MRGDDRVHLRSGGSWKSRSRVEGYCAVLNDDRVGLWRIPSFIE